MAGHGGQRIPGTPRYRKEKELAHGTEPFFPNFLLKEWIAGAMFLVAFIVWIVFNKVDLGNVANPQDTSFIPIPDWYFLFLYEILKYFPGKVIWLGTVVMPGIASLILILLPWMDTRKVRHPFKRPIATTAMVMTLLLMIWTTYEAREIYKEEVAKAGPAPTAPAAPAVKETALVDPNDPGAQLFKNTCAACHGADLKGKVGPSLLGIGNKYDRAALEKFVLAGKGGMPPRGTVTDDAQLKQILDWVEKQKQQ